MLIFPLSALILKLMPGEGALPQGHPSTCLAMQSAFTVPLGLLVAVALGAFAPELFFPASLIIVGTHYLIFISLYGMKSFAMIAGALVLVGTIALFFVPAIAPISGWIGAGTFVIFVPVLFKASSLGEPQGD